MTLARLSFAVLFCFLGFSCATFRTIHYEPQRLPGDRNFRVVVFSDLHVNRPTALLEQMIETINGSSPDLVLFLGDLMENNSQKALVQFILINQTLLAIMPFAAFQPHIFPTMKERGRRRSIVPQAAFLDHT